MKLKKFVSYGSLCLLFTGCATTSLLELGGSTEKDSKLLQKQAEIRAQQISDIDYQLEFFLENTKKTFHGKNTIGFSFDSEKSKKLGFNDTFIDFAGGTIKSFLINGKKIKNPVYTSGRIQIELKQLINGRNTVEIEFEHPYSLSGEGLHRFVDPVDKKVYLYSNLEPYDARRVFPCFDQPDLKASYTMKVHTPSFWQVIANRKETKKIQNKETSIWIFPKTKRFSTYIWALHAGPYAFWKSYARTPEKNIELRLFVRQTLKKYIDYWDWFKATEQGFLFYNKAFGVAYPFEKYDQLIVPEFNAGAMENVGAVTYSERYVSRSQITKDLRINRAEVILHEMAHMWFGNLVTMKWWNDLWLNESFATFTSAWALDAVQKKLKLDGAWHHFFSDIKTWAYWKDQLPTTHPILASVPDTDSAFALFDGITYGKGASSLKQLFYYVGEKGFRKGLKKYFSKYAYQNTTLNDFIQAISEGSGKDLTRWKQAWLMTQGLNTVEAKLSCQKGKIKELSIVQGVNNRNADSILRPHRMEIAFFNKKAQLKKRLKVNYSGKLTAIREAKGLFCPSMILLNDGDYDFVKVHLGPGSQKLAMKSLSKIPGTLRRHMIWKQLWEDVRDAKLAPEIFMETFFKQIPKETDLFIVNDLLKTVIKIRGNKKSTFSYLSPKRKTFYLKKLAKLSKNKMNTVKPGSDIQISWFKTFLNSANLVNDQKVLINWLAGKQIPQGMKFDQVRRWEVIQTLGRLNSPQLQELLEAEKKKDPSQFGKKEAAVAEVMIPSHKIKEKWIKQILRIDTPKDQQLRLDELRNPMSVFFTMGQEELTQFAIPKFFDSLERLSETESETYLDKLTSLFFPGSCDADFIHQTETYIQNHSELPPSVIGNLKNGLDESKRCLEILQSSVL